MEIGSEVDTGERARRAALIARWKSPQGCAARARVLSLLQSREVRFMDIREAAELVGLSADRTEAAWVDLRGIDLCGLDLHGCHVRADFSYGTFDRANLNSADMLYCGFRKASLRNVQAQGALFGAIRATGAVFDAADLTGAIFTTAVLNDVSFRAANLERAMMELAQVHRADFRDARLTRTRFEQTSVASALFDLRPAGEVKP